MEIVQSPATLSLAGNLAKIIIQSAKQFSFVLKKGNTVLCDSIYNPGNSGKVEIDIKEIVLSSLQFHFLDSTDPYAQKDLSADFSIIVKEDDNTEEISFKAVKAGVDRDEIDAGLFLSANFLTWQPQVKKVTYSSPEYLTFYPVVESSMKVKAYFNEDGRIIEEVITLCQVAAGIAQTVPVIYAVIAGKFSGRLPAFYDVWIEDVNGQRLSYIQRYIAGSCLSEEEQWYLWENSLGGIDSIRAYGDLEFSADHTHKIAVVEDVSTEYTVNVDKKHTKSTGYLTEKERLWFLDFFPSKNKYSYYNGTVRRIVVTDDDVNYLASELPTSYKFTYQYADARPYLDIQRVDDLPDVLDVNIPDLGSFTIPPRLVEFPAQILSEGVLLPSQHPFSEDWSRISVLDLYNYIRSKLNIDSGEGGGVGHIHNNYELLQSLLYQAGYLLVSGNKIKSGYADIADGLTERVLNILLRKDKEDQTEFLLKLLGGAEFGEFIDSMIAGKGAGIFPDGRGQFRRLEVSGSMTVMDLIINQIQGMESDYSFAEIGKIESVEDLGDNTYRLKIEKRTEFDFTKFQENDVCFSIINTLLTGGSDYYTSWMRVLTKNAQENTITVVVYPDSEVPGGKNYPPLAGYNLTRRGNSVLPEEGQINERAQSWMLSSREGRIMFLSNVFKPVLEDYNYSISIGKFPKVKALDKLPISENETGIMAQTIIAEKFYQYDYNGDIVPNKVDRGEWSLSVAQSGAPYRFIQHERTSPSGSEYTLLEQHTVYHLGCKWGCLSDKTTDEPKWNSPSWSLLEGDSRYSLRLSLSGGEAFVVGAVDTVMTANILYGNIDITDDVMELDGAEVEWFRDSGNVPADNNWNPSYVDEGKLDEGKLSIHIDNSNQHGVGSDFGFTAKSVSFICRVYIPVGGEFRTVEQRFGFDIL